MKPNLPDRSGLDVAMEWAKKRDYGNFYGLAQLISEAIAAEREECIELIMLWAAANHFSDEAEQLIAAIRARKK